MCKTGRKVKEGRSNNQIDALNTLALRQPPQMTGGPSDSCNTRSHGRVEFGHVPAGRQRPKSSTKMREQLRRESKGKPFT